MDDQVAMWTVLQFVDDGTVEAVPSIWIQGDFCHWPSFPQSKMVTAIRKCEPLNTCWPMHKVKIFRNATYNDYTTARNKAKIAEETSDLNAPDESDCKRKRVQKLLSSSDDSLNENMLSPPPKIKRFKKKIENPENELPKNGDDESCADEQPASNDIGTHNAHTKCKNCTEKDNNNYRTLIQQNHIMRSLLTDILAEVKEIKKTRQVPMNENTAEHIFFKTPGLNFPIDNDEEFQHLEVILNNEQEFQNAVHELHKLGGSSEYDHVKRLLNLILTNNQTLKYSWLGRKGKRPFHNLNLAKLLIRSVEQTGLAKSQKETESAIQAWLRRASDRRASYLKKF